MRNGGVGKRLGKVIGGGADFRRFARGATKPKYGAVRIIRHVRAHVDTWNVRNTRLYLEYDTRRYVNLPLSSSVASLAQRCANKCIVVRTRRRRARRRRARIKYLRVMHASRQTRRRMCVCANRSLRPYNGYYPINLRVVQRA